MTPEAAEAMVRKPASPIDLLDALQEPIGSTLQAPLPSKAVRRPDIVAALLRAEASATDAREE